MKIGIDARLYGLSNRGIGRYTENLVKKLETIDSQNQYLIFLHKNNFEEYQPQNKNFTKILLPYRWYTFAEQIFLPFILNKYRLDLIHYLHFNAPYFGPKNFIVTLHDLTLLNFSDRRASKLPVFVYRLKYFLFKFLQKRIINKAKYIITPSNFVKKDLLKNYSINPDKIKVVYEGLNELNIIGTSDIFNKFEISRPYFFYVGAAYPHKNLDRLVDAFSRINNEKNWQLVIAGRADYFMNKLIKKVEKNKIDSIIFTDFIKEAELCQLYHQALALVYPSLSEGFGLPGIEAQAQAIPVCSSDQTALKEILGRGALYFDPYDLEDIQEKMLRIATDNNLRNKLIKFGLNNIKNYNWQITSQQTLNLYYNFDQTHK